MREPVHAIPTQASPQGSPPSQLGGTFFHSFTRDLIAEAAEELDNSFLDQTPKLNTEVAFPNDTN